MPKIPYQLFGLMSWSAYGQKLVAQVLTTSKNQATELFSELYEFVDGSVVQLGGLSLPYVKEMKPNIVLEME